MGIELACQEKKGYCTSQMLPLEHCKSWFHAPKGVLTFRSGRMVPVLSTVNRGIFCCWKNFCNLLIFRMLQLQKFPIALIIKIVENKWNEYMYIQRGWVTYRARRCPHFKTTIIWEVFVVKIFLWGRQTMKIKRTNIRLQQNLVCLIFVGCYNPQNILTWKFYTQKNLTQKFPKLQHFKPKDRLQNPQESLSRSVQSCHCFCQWTNTTSSEMWKEHARSLPCCI